jgi:hypothetical protein
MFQPGKKGTAGELADDGALGGFAVAHSSPLSALILSA